MTTTTPDRVQDARLHTALYGVPCEWRACSRDPESGVWGEQQSCYERSLAEAQTDGGDIEYHKAVLRACIEDSMACRNDGIQNRMQPCARHNYGDKLQSVWAVDGEWWDVVPFYSTDIAASHEAEGALPEATREKYLRELDFIVSSHDFHTRVESMWLMRRATPAQMVAAMLSALEGK